MRLNELLWARWVSKLRARLARYDIGELLSISAESLGRYKLRTALSIVGVILGVAAVIAIMSVSQGARHEALQQFDLLGLDNIVIRNRGFAATKPGTGELTIGDAQKLRELLPLTTSLTPLIETYQLVSGPVQSDMAGVLGVNSEYQKVLRLRTSRGRFLTPADLRTNARVCVLGATLARSVFGYRRLLGESVRIEGEWFQVVGVLEERSTGARLTGPFAARDLDQAALVPLTAMLGHSLDTDRWERIDEIWLQIEDGERVMEIGRIAEHTLACLHNRQAVADVIIPRELLDQRLRTQRTFNVVVGSLAVISLLVGGIGIMNIMLASVLERTREIGIRRTVGATRRDVTIQFITETLVMTLSGGAAGILLGVLVSVGITAYAGWSTRLSIASVYLAFLVSLAVGLIFGIYPARKAALLDPIEAVRYE